MNLNARIKICGLRLEKDVNLAEELGAWALGFIFYKESPRFISPKEVAKIASRVKIKKVGVFVNAGIDEIIEGVETSHVDTVQLHGEEDSDFCNILRIRLPRLKIIKVLRPRKIEELERLRTFGECESFLLDTFSETKFGGTGVTGDWAIAKMAAKNFPIILSGGITSHNVASSLNMVSPFAVDVSSGVETSPGVKDHDEMRRFFNEAWRKIR